MHNEDNEHFKFKDIYPIVVTQDNDDSVMNLPFSVRLKNALMRSNITTLSAILATKISDFEEIRNLGAKSKRELLDFLEKGLSCDAKQSNAPTPRIVIDYIEEILTLDENLKNNLTDEDRKHTKPYYDAVEILGTEFAMFCYKCTTISLQN